MSLETETTNKNKTKEFESLLNEDFKKETSEKEKLLKQQLVRQEKNMFLSI